MIPITSDEFDLVMLSCTDSSQNEAVCNFLRGQERTCSITFEPLGFVIK